MENKIGNDTIDLGKLINIGLEHKKEITAIIAGCTIAAIGIAFVLPKKYESTTLVQIRATGKDIGGAAALASLMGGGGSSLTLSSDYIELMKSRRVLEPIIDNMDWEGEKKKPESDVFAKKYLDIENKSKTSLITITAKGKTAEEAQMISQGVADNFLKLQTDMNQQTQSLLVKFLEERIEEAKKDAEDSRVNFAQYQQKHKIYSPDEQARMVVAKMNAFDDAIKNMEVQQKAGQAKLAAVEAKLGDMRSSSKNYNINDNEIIKGLRNQIVSAQIELVNLRENYTDEHPLVISTKEKIDKLNQSLTDEVNTMVASKYTTLNPAQADLISQQANTEADIAVAKASEEAIRARKDEKEQELEGFPKDVLEYLNLQRDTNIKEQIYTNLVKQAEDNKIKEAMESMDIQVIDSANLPDDDEWASPNRGLITILGAIIGSIISFLYIFRLSKKY